MDTDLYQTWFTAYDKLKKLNGQNNNVMTSMIWGSLWDETLQWLLESGGIPYSYRIAEDSLTWGNYEDATFHYIPVGSETPEVSVEKATGERVLIPAGSSDYTKVNNIYDLAGNASDGTLESNGSLNRNTRGGDVSSEYCTAAERQEEDFLAALYSTTCGARSILLIR